MRKVRQYLMCITLVKTEQNFHYHELSAEVVTSGMFLGKFIESFFSF